MSTLDEQLAALQQIGRVAADLADKLALIRNDFLSTPVDSGENASAEPRAPRATKGGYPSSARRVSDLCPPVAPADRPTCDPNTLTGCCRWDHDHDEETP